MAAPGDTVNARRAWARTLAVFIAITSLVYWPLWRGDVLFFRDLTRWIFPARSMAPDW